MRLCKYIFRFLSEGPTNTLFRAKRASYNCVHITVMIHEIYRDKMLSGIDQEKYWLTTQRNEKRWFVKCHEIKRSFGDKTQATRSLPSILCSSSVSIW